MSETDEETVRSELVGGVIQREYWGWDHKACVVLCLDPPRRKRRSYCPGCGGKVTVKPLGQADVEPEPGRLAALIAGVRQGMRDAERLLARWEKRPAAVTIQVGIICKGGTFV